MPLIPTGSLAIGIAVLGAAWLGPLPALASHSFAVHMTMHIAVVAVAAPLLAFGIAGSIADPVRMAPALAAPIPASMIELIVVWAWHVPALHEAARLQTWALVLEQGCFAVAGLWLWIASIGGEHEQRRLRAGSGILALLFTSMHMTLLGALFAIADRPLFHAANASSVADQQLGGVIMLLVGGASYLLGGLCLMGAALRSSSGASSKRRPTAV